MSTTLEHWDILPPVPLRTGSAPVAPSQHLEVISGEVDEILHYTEDTGYTVFVLRNGAYQSTVTGITARLQVGEGARCFGSWNTSKWGRQFKTERIEITEPSGQKALQRYLHSGAVPGIGRHFGDLLLEQFGENLMEVLETQPERLRQLPGIGPKRLENLLRHIERLRNERRTMVFLLAHGLGPGRAARIAGKYKEQTEQILRENPYRIAVEIDGIGFKLADDLAMKLGIAATDPARLEAGLVYTLEQAESEGHSYLPQSELIKLARKLLHVPEDLLQTATTSLLQKSQLLLRNWPGKPGCVYLPGTDWAERLVSARLLRLLQDPIPWAGRLSAQLPTVPGITLSDKQKAAVQLMLNSKVAVLQGGPGVGKTTITRSMLLSVKKAGIRVALCAPTGKAAKRLAEATGEQASTIHRLLEVDPVSAGFKHHEKNPLPYDLVIVDEASMIDIQLMAALLRAVGNGAGLWIIGDPEQIPSVGSGAVLQDIIQSNTVPVALLSEIFRQAEASKIIVNAHRIIRGELPEKPAAGEESDFYFFGVEDNGELPAKIQELVLQKIPQKFGFDPIQDIQVLTHLRRGPLGSEDLAHALQKQLLPAKRPLLESFGRQLGVGDRVLQRVNNYDKTVFNGENGTVTRVLEKERILQVKFDDREVEYHISELGELSLAYALTIHKSQGSEYPVVVLPISSSYHVMLEQQLLYTGVTRGKKLVVLVGQMQALATAVRTRRASLRKTALTERLQLG